MKHPKYRVSDIAYMDPVVRDELYAYVQGVKPLLHPFIRDKMVKFEHVGSYTFGNAKLYSDMDFNIAMKDWNDQVEARRLFYGNIGRWRGRVEEYFMELRRRWDLKIDLGCVDCDSAKYNINVSMDDMILHHRYSELNEILSYDGNGVIWLVPDEHPIDLKTFDPLTHEPLPIAHQHLKWHSTMHRWQRIVLKDGNPAHLVPYLDNRQASWAEDPFASEIPEWQAKYGSRFLTYTNIDGRLVMD